MIVWYLDFQLSVQSVPITTSFARCTRYNLMWYSLTVPCDRSVGSSTNKTDRHDIAEILLEVALNTINLNLNLHCMNVKVSFLSPSFLAFSISVQSYDHLIPWLKKHWWNDWIKWHFGCLAARCGVGVTYLQWYIFVIFDVKY